MVRWVCSGADSDTVSTYEGMAADYVAELEESPFNALYERPGVIALLPEVADRRVLDVGCGSGPLSEWLVNHGAAVVGFDSSPSMLAAAEARKLPNASFCVADLADPLAFLDDSTFYVAVASLVMHYLRDWVSPLRELRRVLTDDGVLVLSTHHPARDVELSVTGNYLATELLEDRWQKAGREYKVSFWRRPLTEMFSAFDAAGFQVQTLTEPQPLPECERRFPSVWQRLSTEPNYIFFALRPRR
jgi:SAM-dependent methyltransferase